jgi:5-carboxymethyl-2-hydroxymuconate isomerase
MTRLLLPMEPNMPQLILEYSANIIEKASLFKLLNQINTYLSDHLPTELLSCKSRAYECNTFCIGDGDANNAFVHINLKVMSGREEATLNEVGSGIMHLLKDYLIESAIQHRLQITLEIEELQKTYFKYVLKS